MTLAPPSWVVVALDTHPPQVSASTAKYVDTTEDWVVTLTGDEPLGGADLWVEDAYGAQMAVGYEEVSDTTLRVVVATDALVAGTLRLKGSVWDAVGNAAPVEITTALRGARGLSPSFRATLSIGRAYDVELGFDNAFDGELGLGRGFVSFLEVADA